MGRITYPTIEIIVGNVTRVACSHVIFRTAIEGNSSDRLILIEISNLYITLSASWQLIYGNFKTLCTIFVKGQCPPIILV
jgi:hypothetical protein